MAILTETEMQTLLFHAPEFNNIEINENDIIQDRWVEHSTQLHPESICGIDERKKVVATQQLPYMAICKLYMKGANGLTYVGSGWLVDKDRLYTAGHCVFNAKSGGWKKSIVVIPAKSGLSEPYGRYHATAYMATRGWVEQGSPRYDMGAIKLDRAVSHHRFLKPVLNDPDSGEVCGYPNDRDNGIFQYKMSEKLTKNSGRFEYSIDTYGGQSGSPLLKNRTHAVGIHNYGGCPNKSSDLYQRFIDGVANW